jgi:hypothetical protein
MNVHNKKAVCSHSVNLRELGDVLKRPIKPINRKTLREQEKVTLLLLRIERIPPQAGPLLGAG